jgi:hypothetical protein
VRRHTGLCAASAFGMARQDHGSRWAPPR